MKHLLFALLVVALAVGFANAQQVSDFNTAELTVSNQLNVAGQHALTAEVAPGTTYHFVQDGAAATAVLDPPDALGATDMGDNMVWDITAQDGSNLTYSFGLPSAFVGTLLGSIPISYGPGDGIYFDLTNEYAFDPHNAYSAQIASGAGAAQVYLNFSFTVPVNITADTYLATFFLTASQTGL